MGDREIGSLWDSCGGVTSGVTLAKSQRPTHFMNKKSVFLSFFFVALSYHYLLRLFEQFKQVLLDGNDRQFGFGVELHTLAITVSASVALLESYKK